MFVIVFFYILLQLSGIYVFYSVKVYILDYPALKDLDYSTNQTSDWK